VVSAPVGCSNPDRWTDAFLIAEAHRAEKGVCACGRPLPCIAAQRADEIMAETMVAANAAAEAAHAAAALAEEQRRISRAITQELPVLRLPEPEEAPVGARFYRPKQRDDEPAPVPAPEPTGFAVPVPAAAPVAPTGARFYRERKPPRHRG
jgi:hypothetical protein